MSDFHFSHTRPRDATQRDELARRRAAFDALPIEQQDTIRAQFEAMKGAAAAFRAHMVAALAAKAIEHAKAPPGSQ